MSAAYISLAKKMLISRFSQLIVNEFIKAKAFKIPIHLALGHEALAEAVASAMSADDKLLCTHRNIHYQLACGATLQSILEEFKLSNSGLAQGMGGSMNLTNPCGAIVYTSSILGNNLGVGVGVALSKRVKSEDGVIFVVTGDGAMEEGAFYESIENARNMDLPFLLLVENNNWSLSSKIEERRKPINLDKFANSLGARYTLMEGNNPIDYHAKIMAAKERVISEKVPEILEVEITTLGSWTINSSDFPNGKFVNYHAGLAPNLFLESPIINNNSSDPIHLAKEILGVDRFNDLVLSVKGEFLGYGLA